jgi:hypothetical protein
VIGSSDNTCETSSGLQVKVEGFDRLMGKPMKKLGFDELLNEEMPNKKTSES